MKNAWRFAPVLAALISGCAYVNRPDTVQQALNRPAPAEAQRRSQDCANIAAQLARQQSLHDDKAAAIEDPFEHAKAKAEAERNIPALKAKQAELDCASAPPPAVAPAVTTAPAAAPAAEADGGFDRCFERCRRYTDRTKEQCFDVCNGH